MDKVTSNEGAAKKEEVIVLDSDSNDGDDGDASVIDRGRSQYVAYTMFTR